MRVARRTAHIAHASRRVNILDGVAAPIELGGIVLVLAHAGGCHAVF